VQHSIKLHVVHEFSSANGCCESRIFCQWFPDTTVDSLCLNGFILPEDSQSLFDSFDDLHITGATAHVLVNGFRDLLTVCQRIFGKQHLGAHDQSRRAESALDGSFAHISRSNGIANVLRNSFHGDDLCPLEELHLLGTGQPCFPVDLHGACSTGGLSRTTIFRGGDPGGQPEVIQQASFGIAGIFYGLVIQEECSHGG